MRVWIPLGDIPLFHVLPCFLTAWLYSPWSSPEYCCFEQKYIQILGWLWVETDQYAFLWRTNEKQNKKCTPNKHLFNCSWIIKNTKTGWPKCSYYHSPIFLPSHPPFHWHFRFRYLLLHSLLRTVSKRENKTKQRRSEEGKWERHKANHAVVLHNRKYAQHYCGEKDKTVGQLIRGKNGSYFTALKVNCCRFHVCLRDMTPNTVFILRNRSCCTNILLRYSDSGQIITNFPHSCLKQIEIWSSNRGADKRLSLLVSDAVLVDKQAPAV
jgi:hypothetical protein